MLKPILSDIEESLSILHDSLIAKLFFNRNEGVRLEFLTAKKTSCTLIIKNIDKLFIDNFREGNIVLDAELYLPDEIEKSNIAEYYDKKDLKKYFIDNDLIAVEISPSYGAKILLSCKSNSLEFNS